MNEYYKSFEETAYKILPGFLYSFNIADAKRRNSHLGYKVVDQDIEEFNNILKQFLTEDSFVKRVSGDKWFMVSKNNENEQIQSILEQYAKSDPIEVGWRVHAKKGGENKSKEETSSSEIFRAIRCIYKEIRSPDELVKAIDEIEENDWSLPVNTPLLLDDVLNMDRMNWKCVSTYPTKNPDTCLFCGNKEFEWLDGDMSVYSGDGVCKKCGAEISVWTIDG